MPNFTPDTLRQIGYALFEAAGCSHDDARTVTDHLIESNLFGHDSHGAIRFYDYIRAIREGRFHPTAKPQIVRETPCTSVVDGGGALGQIGAGLAMRLAIQKAKEHGIAAVSVRNTSHVGRVGAYPLMAAREGLIALAFANAGRLGYQVAPFGGIDGRLSTNPIAFAAPRRNADPILVDVTTSVVAEGKIRVAINEGKSVPEGWIIDHEGRPTTTPKDFKADPPGAILPMGGVVAHKGYGLSCVVELLGGTLSGEGCAAGSRQMKSNGVLFTAYHIEHFTDLETYYNEVEGLIRHVTSSRTAPGFTEILIPGEPEFRTARRREAGGIDIDETTWAHITDAAKTLGVDPTAFIEKK
ncbi:MAG: Ldh family oxidoreductase, partial [Candidatus Latescibacteria bacterium]|nr:Ldh family oxidoreductase [Candidatus Latescibacterota bacterium]